MSSFRQSVTIRSAAAGSLSNGVYTRGALTDGTIKASVQPLKPEEVKNLPEGRWSRKAYWVTTNTFLNLGSSATPDFVVIDGIDFEIEQREQWRNNVISHYRYMVLAPVEA